MREDGLIKGWGIGVNTPEPILRVIQESDPDVCLLASQYSLIDHANALNNVFPVARQRNVKFVIGSSLNPASSPAARATTMARRPGTFLASTSRSERGCALWRRSSAPICEPLRFSSLRRRTSPRR